MTDETLITIKQASDKWGVTPRTIRRWIAAGRLESFSRSGRTLVKPELPEPVTIKKVAVAMTLREPEDTENLTHDRHPNAEISAMLTGVRRRTFAWQLLAMTAIVTAAVLGSLLYIGHEVYQDREERLIQGQTSLTATVERYEKRLTAAEQRAIIAEEQTRELASQVAEALKAEREARPVNPWGY